MSESMQRRILDSLKDDAATEFSLRLAPHGEAGEKYLFLGNQATLPGHVSLFLAIKQLIEGSTLVKFIGEPWDKYNLKRKAPLSLQIHWRCTRAEPWEPKGLARRLRLHRNYLPKPRATIQNIDKPTLTWQKIKDAAGGHDGYYYGGAYAKGIMGSTDFETSVTWDLWSYASTKTEAEKRVESLSRLSRDTLLDMVSGEQKEEGNYRRAKERQRQKPYVRIYPAWCIVNNYELIDWVVNGTDNDGNPIDWDNPPSGRATALGQQYKQCDQIFLNTKEPPRAEIEKLRAVLRSPRDLLFGNE